MLSNQYSISNGVKQGGCLSPTLCSIYLIDILCTISTDDIGLLSPILSVLKEMLKLCEDYALKPKQV